MSIAGNGLVEENSLWSHKSNQSLATSFVYVCIHIKLN